MKKLIIFMGTPGMNNMELARYLQVTKYPQAIIHDIYESWLDFPEESYISKSVSWDLYKKIIVSLSNTDTVMVVAPFVLKENRTDFFSFLSLYCPKEIFETLQIIGVWVERKYEDLKILRQLRLPYRQVPDEIFEYLYQYRESPTESESFNDIVYITREINTGMSKSQPYITDILTALNRI